MQALLFSALESPPLLFELLTVSYPATCPSIALFPVFAQAVRKDTVPLFLLALPELVHPTHILRSRTALSNTEGLPACHLHPQGRARCLRRNLQGPMLSTKPPRRGPLCMAGPHWLPQDANRSGAASNAQLPQSYHRGRLRSFTSPPCKDGRQAAWQPSGLRIICR